MIGSLVLVSQLGWDGADAVVVDGLVGLGVEGAAVGLAVVVVVAGEGVVVVGTVVVVEGADVGAVGAELQSTFAGQSQ